MACAVENRSPLHNPVLVRQLEANLLNSRLKVVELWQLGFRAIVS